MPNYMLVYKGDATDMSAMTPEQTQEEMALWGAWYEKQGPAIVDGGAPFAANTTVRADDGSEGPAPLTGYTVVQADSLEAAVAMTDGHPFIREAGNYAIDVYECVDMSPPE